MEKWYLELHARTMKALGGNRHEKNMHFQATYRHTNSMLSSVKEEERRDNA
jgi:hypothetical protein